MLLSTHETRVINAPPRSPPLRPVDVFEPAIDPRAEPRQCSCSMSTGKTLPPSIVNGTSRSLSGPLRFLYARANAFGKPSRSLAHSRGFIRWVLLFGGLLLQVVPVIGVAEEHFLFTSFRDNGQDGLHLALSTNGYQWQAVNNDASVLRPKIGAMLIRDPCLAEGPDGTFHLVWTSGWTTQSGKVIGYSSSKDLVHWSEQRAIALMENEPATRNIWAPEIFYERDHHRWLVFWSSTIPGKFPDSDQSGDDGYNHRIYCATTPDFRTFSASRLFYEPGFEIIDATILQVADRFYLFFKDERRQPLKKNLRYAVAASPEGPYGPPSEPFTGDWVEGPSAIRIGDEYLVYFDHYAPPQYYGAVRSKDLRHWQDCSKEMSFPNGHRHGTVLRISPELAQRLQSEPLAPR